MSVRIQTPLAPTGNVLSVTTKPQDRTIQTTKEYDKFSFMVGNRKPNPAHIARLKKSFEERYLLSPIMVNEAYQIIDGQHRFLAAKDLGLPIHYFRVPGYGLGEVQRLNTNGANWKAIDFLNAYCDLGIESYLQLRKFMKDFPEIKMESAKYLVAGGAQRVERSEHKEGGRIRYMTNLFNEGKFEVQNLTQAYEYANKIMAIKPYYDGFNRRTFVSAMLQLFAIPDFRFEEFMGKLKLQPTALVDCTNATQYRFLIETIYNYKRVKKVNLRY